MTDKLQKLNAIVVIVVKSLDSLSFVRLLFSRFDFVHLFEFVPSPLTSDRLVVPLCKLNSTLCNVRFL